MEIRELNDESFGAYIDGVDLSGDIDNELIKTIRSLIRRHKFIAFRNQNLTMYEYENLASRLGTLIDNMFIDHVYDHPYIIEVSRIPGEKSPYFGLGWHADFTFLPNPATYTLLYGKTIPSTGGDTLFADQIRAYNDLDQDLKSFLDTHNAVHIASNYSSDSSRVKGLESNESSMKYKMVNGTFDPVYLSPHIHPMTYVQEKTGNKAIYVNGYVKNIDNVDHDRSVSLLKTIRVHQVQKQFVQSLKWYPNMIAIWDNRTCIHRATTNYNEPRILYRILVREI